MISAKGRRDSNPRKLCAHFLPIHNREQKKIEDLKNDDLS